MTAVTLLPLTRDQLLDDDLDALRDRCDHVPLRPTVLTEIFDRISVVTDAASGGQVDSVLDAAQVIAVLLAPAADLVAGEVG